MELFKKGLENEHTNITLAYLIPTMACNLRCDYCYIYNNPNNVGISINMTMEVVDTFLEKYVKYLIKNDIRDATIQFYGAEPLRNWEIVKYCITQGRSQFPFSFVIITNGTLLDSAKISFLRENDVGIGLSLDGPKGITDAHRKRINNNESVYEYVADQIENLKESGIRTALSVTITNEFLDIQDEILDWFEIIGIKNINYNLLHFHKNMAGIKDYYSRATDFLIRSYNRLYNKGIFDDRILRKISAFTNEVFYYADCGAAYANQITIKPNGDVGVCQGEFATNHGRIGNILKDPFDTICNNQERLSWKRNTPIYNETCYKCEAISICGGGCLIQSLELDENSMHIDYGFCIHTKKLFFWLLQKLYEVL